MEVERLEGGLALIRPDRSDDGRGWLSEIYSEPRFAASGIDGRFVQDNISRTPEAGVVRGLHAQHPPHAQAKLFRVVRGEVFNVAVDLRPARFGATDARRLGEGVWIHLPEGFAHGFQTLQPDVEVYYKVTRPFAPDHLLTLDWDAPELAIPWPVPPRRDLRSRRDSLAQPPERLRGAFA